VRSPVALAVLSGALALASGLLSLASHLLPAADPLTVTRATFIHKEMARLEGTWQLVSSQTGDQKMPPEQARQIRVVIKGSLHTVYFGKKVLARGVAFRIDPLQKPKWVEDTLQDGKTIRGIYELDGDTLRSCFAPPGKDRLTKFSPNKGHTLRVFQRVRR
jgi:uncharacterized protein (TIGR03067 family)